MMTKRDNAIKEFEFTDEGRKFFCSVELPSQAGMKPWWWFRLDSGSSTRYAPFEASPSDTKESVQERIIAYHAALLAIEARPVHQRPVWRKPEPATPPVETIPVTTS